jgi:hypothetical protein
MNCPQARDQLAELLYGELKPEWKDLLEKHLAECSGCRREHLALAGVRQMLDQVPAPGGQIDLSRLYREAALAQERRLRRWRRLALSFSAAAAVFVVLVVGLRLEARLEPHQMVLRWGPPPTTEMTSPPQPLGLQESGNACEERLVAAFQEQLELHGKLIHALADDVQALERQERHDAGQLQVRLQALQQQNTQRWLAINRTLDALYSLSQKGE